MKAKENEDPVKQVKQMGYFWKMKAKKRGKDQITQWVQMLRTPIKAQAQSELGPEIFKAHFEYAPATSKCTVQ
jgi:hypothetical protein